MTNATATEMAQSDEQLSAWARARQHAGDYLLGRQSPNGAFCFYRSEYLDEPNLADTHHALIALKQLGHSPRQQETLRRWLDRFAAETQPSVLYHRFGALRLIAPDWQPSAAERAAVAAISLGPSPSAGAAEASGWLYRARHIAGLWSWLGEQARITTLGQALIGLQHDGGFGPGPNLWDSWQALDILALAGMLDAVAPGAARYLEALQEPHFGFRSTPRGGLPRLAELYAARACCKALNLTIRHPAAALRFVLACQTGRGGFANAPDALPDIELTHLALACGDRLCELLMADTGHERAAA